MGADHGYWYHGDILSLVGAFLELSNFAWSMYSSDIVLLLIGYTFLKCTNSGALDRFRFIQFQPTELAKIIIILFARFMVDRRSWTASGTLAKSAGLLAVPLYLILDEPDLKNHDGHSSILCSDFYIAQTNYSYYRRKHSDCSSLTGDSSYD